MEKTNTIIPSRCSALPNLDKSDFKVGSDQKSSNCRKNEKGMMDLQKWGRNEIQMLKTSIWIIVFFSFCWIPYGILVLLRDLAPMELKQVH